MAPRAHLLRELLAAGGFSQQPSVVDIGAGFGVFLEEVRSSGVCDRLLAIEPNPALATVCRTKGIEVVEKSLESVEEGEVSASMATCFEVLEHVFDPLAFLRGARRALRPGGEMLLTTLTSSGFDIQVLWEHSDSVFPPHHINLLSLEGVRRLAERAGLEVVDISTPGELDVDIVRNKLAQHSELAVPRFIRRLVTESSEVIVGRFQQFLKDASLSSHLRIVLRRTAST
jgi:SAM-dependent methyltransferase